MAFFGRDTKVDRNDNVRVGHCAGKFADDVEYNSGAGAGLGQKQKGREEEGEKEG